FDALETVTTYDRQQGRVVLSGPGVEVVLAARAPGGIATTPWRRLEIDAFNQAVGVAAASGASWPADPLRVALAFVDLSAALETTVSLSYGRPGARQGPEGDRSAANVNVVESGFLDDAVTGATQRDTLERRANHWVVTGH